MSQLFRQQKDSYAACGTNKQSTLRKSSEFLSNYMYYFGRLLQQQANERHQAAHVEQPLRAPRFLFFEVLKNEEGLILESCHYVTTSIIQPAPLCCSCIVLRWCYLLAIVDDAFIAS